MSADKLKEIINIEFYTVFKKMCLDEKEIANNRLNVKSMDDVPKLSYELVKEFNHYSLESIIDLWLKVKRLSDLDSIVPYLLEKHFDGINSYPSPSISHFYSKYVGHAALSCLEKAIAQSIITGNLKLKVESGLLENFKKRQMNRYSIPFEEIPVTDMIPWKKSEVLANNSLFKPATDKKQSQPTPVSKSEKILTING